MKSENLIKFGMARDYIPDWGVSQALREIFQNFLDYGEYQTDIVKLDEDHSFFYIRNNYTPDSFEFLKIGTSKKAEGSIGGHGEGLKLALMVLLRNGIAPIIETPLGIIKGAWYTDPNLGECFGVIVENDDCSSGFTVSMNIETKYIERFTKTLIKEEDILHSCSYGKLLNKPEGEIYSGSLYVTTLDRMKHSFDIDPRYLPLGRDRTFPSTFDIEYYSSKILSSYHRHSEKMSTRKFMESLEGRESNYMESVPGYIADRFKPSICERGKVTLSSGKTVISDPSRVSKFMRNPKLIQKVEKLRYRAVVKGKPYDILKRLRTELNLTEVETVKFNEVLKKSRKWKA